jgi:hypothetical protein
MISVVIDLTKNLYSKGVMIMGNKIAIVHESNLNFEWIYVNGKRVKEGTPIHSVQWMNLIKKYAPIQSVLIFDLMPQYSERTDYVFDQIPIFIHGFQDGDLQEVA